MQYKEVIVTQEILSKYADTNKLVAYIHASMFDLTNKEVSDRFGLSYKQARNIVSLAKGQPEGKPGAGGDAPGADLRSVQGNPRATQGQPEVISGGIPDPDSSFNIITPPIVPPPEKTSVCLGRELTIAETNAGYSPEFVCFMEAYPRQTHKDAAWREWQNTQGVENHVDAILQALSWQKQLDEWTQKGGKFIPNPARYLADGRWKDEVFRETTESKLNKF